MVQKLKLSNPVWEHLCHFEDPDVLSEGEFLTSTLIKLEDRLISAGASDDTSIKCFPNPDVSGV